MNFNKIKNRSRLYWLMQVLGWGSFSFVVLLFNYFQKGQVGFRDLVFSDFLFASGIMLSHFVRYVFKRYKWTDQDIREILHKLGLLSVFVGATNVLLLYSISNSCGHVLLKEFSLVSFASFSITFALIYFIWGTIYFTDYFFRNFKKEEIKNLTQKAYLNEIQLNKFKSQLNPHFVFNALNGIRSLIDEDKVKSKESITRLSNILRHTLSIDKKKLIFLEEEMKLVEDYLNLEKIRFEERLNYQFNLPLEAFKYEVPPMLLQTLVENAIKHGISNLIKGGDVIINAVENDRGLDIEIINDGQFKPESKNEGYGIENSKQRLELIFKGEAEISIENLNDNQVITKLFIPKL